MKKTLLALTVLALTATAASAQTTTPAGTAATAGTAAHQMERAGRGPGKGGQHQGQKSPAQQADRHATKMAQELSLTADQKAQVESIFLAQNQEMTALKAKYAAGTNRQAMRPEAKAIHDKYDAQLRTALGTDAYARYDQQRDQRHDRMKQLRGGKEGKSKLKAKS